MGYRTSLRPVVLISCRFAFFFSSFHLSFAVLISFSEKTAVHVSYDPRKNDNRAGGIWVPPHHDNVNRQRRWFNEDYTVLASANGNNADNDNHSLRRLSAAAAGGAEPARYSCHLHKVRTLSTTTTRTTQDNDTVETIKDWLFLEVSRDQVMIAIVLEDEQDGDNSLQQHWILTEEQHYAIPGSTMQTPVSGQLRDNEAPFAAAQRVAFSVLRMDFQSTIPDIPIVLDKYHLADGRILKSHDSRQQLQWTFLGRYRNLSDAGGGFTYTYMLKAPRYISNAVIPKYVEYQQTNVNSKQKESRHLSDGNDHDRTTTTALFSMSTEEIRLALLKGDFAEIKGAATIGLALQHNMET